MYSDKMEENIPNEFRGESVSETRRSVESELQDLEAESLAESLPEGFNVDEKNYPTKKGMFTYTKVKDRVPIFLCITHGAIWGLLARKGLEALTTYNGSFIPGVIWANFAACLIMGMAVDSSNLWEEMIGSGEYAHKGEIPVYTGITTGFCGTFSSFSSVMLEVFYKSADTTPGKHYQYPNAAYGIMEFLATVLAHFGLSIMGFHMGKHLIEMYDKYSPMLKNKTYKKLEILSSTIGLSLFIIVIILIGVKDNGSWRSWTFACFFAPFGALIRYYLSRYLNSKVKNFPLGTFTANLSGTLFLSIFTLLSRGKLPSDHHKQIVTNILGCHVLSGLDDGFCGGLTTVSTFVVELFGLKTSHSYRYGSYSVIASYILVVLILGVFNWTVGLTQSVCT